MRKKVILQPHQSISFHQYQVVGRKLPTASDGHPEIYRMKLWATNEVRAKSKFWYFLRKLKKVKKSNGQVLAIKWFLLNSPPGLIQFETASEASPRNDRLIWRRDMKQKQGRKSHMKWVFYVGGNAFFAMVPGQVLLASLDAIKLKPLQRTRKNRSHLYSKVIKRKIPFQQTSRCGGCSPHSLTMRLGVRSPPMGMERISWPAVYLH
ncbi:unnamed protein product [Prunus brigantina]